MGPKDLGKVGGKNASLGELFNALKPRGIGVLDGFATTADAYRHLLTQKDLDYKLRSRLDFDVDDVGELAIRGHADRDSGTVAYLFDERDDAVRDMIAQVIEAAKTAGKPIGICGQAPSDYPDFARWLVERGITSISLNPDTAIKTTFLIAEAEARRISDTTLPGTVIPAADQTAGIHAM